MRAHVDYLTQIDVNVMAVSDSKGYNLKRMLELAQRKIRQTSRKVIEIAVNNDIGLRDPAVNMAKERIAKASKKNRFFIFVLREGKGKSNKKKEFIFVFYLEFVIGLTLRGRDV